MPKFGGPVLLRSHPEQNASDAVAAASCMIETACRQTVAGKLAVRRLAAWTRPVAVSEMEFRLLWMLCQPEWIGGDRRERDQAELAELLAVSAAQVSAVVERLRQKELIEPLHDGADRRRQLWRVTQAGLAKVDSVVAQLASGESNVPDISALNPSFEAGDNVGEAA